MSYLKRHLVKGVFLVVKRDVVQQGAVSQYLLLIVRRDSRCPLK